MMRKISEIETRFTTGVSQVADTARKVAQQVEGQRQHRAHLRTDQAPIRGAQPRLQTR